METFKLLIAGAADFNDYDRLLAEASKIVNAFSKESIVIIANPTTQCGMLAEKYAAEMGYEVDEFYEDSIIEMAKGADACLYFNDGTSKEIEELVNYANRYRFDLKELLLFIIEEPN